MSPSQATAAATAVAAAAAAAATAAAAAAATAATTIQSSSIFTSTSTTSSPLSTFTSLSESYTRLEACFVPCVSAAVCFWIPVHTITFSSVPVPWRITWVSTAAVSWTVFMSYMNAAQTRREEEARRGGSIDEK